MENIWKKSLSILQTEVNEQVFTMWFQPIQQVAAGDGSITLGVPNKFFEDWIKGKYISLIKTALQQASGTALSINFKIMENCAPAAAPEGKGDAPPKRDEEEHKKGWLTSIFGAPRQAPEDQYQKIGLNRKYTFDSFVVGPNNRFAHAAAKAICEKLSQSYNPFFLHGGVGLGKTHLMQAMGHDVLKNHPKAKVLYISSEKFTNQLIDAIRKRTTQQFRAMYRHVDILLIDDIQFIAGKDSTQEEFFHTFNTLYDSHKQIVLCSDRSPKDIPALEERLVSRFAWGLVADIQAPDFETRVAIMEKKSEAESVKVSKDVLFFLAENIKTNIREMEGALIRVVAHAKLIEGEMTVSLAKDVLKGMITAEEKKITIDLIQQSVADFFNIKVSDMAARKKTRAIVFPRQVAMYLSRKLTDYSLPDLGGFFGGRDHTTVLHACAKIDKELAEKEETRAVVKKLTRVIKK